MNFHKITDLLRIEVPIIQGAMAWISDAHLVSAVSEAGALGVLAAGHAPASWVKEQIQIIRKKTKKPFGVNLMLLSPHADDVALLIAEEQIQVVITGAGDPARYLPLWQKKGIKVLPVVASCALAKRMEKQGCDALIAEGAEAGGHIGKLNTMALVPLVRDAVSIPVVAAGGIADGRGMMAAFSLGAQGVQIGTRFIVAEECGVHQNYKDKILKAKDIDTAITGQFTGHPVRVLRNKLSKILDKLPPTPEGRAQFEALSRGSLQLAAIHGDTDMGSVMSGQIAALVHQAMSAKEIVQDLMADFERVYRELYATESLFLNQ